MRSDSLGCGRRRSTPCSGQARWLLPLQDEGSVVIDRVVPRSSATAATVRGRPRGLRSLELRAATEALDRPSRKYWNTFFDEGLCTLISEFRCGLLELCTNPGRRVVPFRQTLLHGLLPIAQSALRPPACHGLAGPCPSRIAQPIHRSHHSVDDFAAGADYWLDDVPQRTVVFSPGLLAILDDYLCFRSVIAGLS